FVGSIVDPMQLDISYGMRVSPDSAYVYVTGRPGVLVYRRDPASGTLSPVQVTCDGFSLSVWIAGDGARAYVCGGLNGLSGYARDPVSGILTRDEHTV